MTSRRDFLGILAVAPVAVPAALSLPQPRYGSGGVLSETSWGVVGEDCYGGFPLSPSQAKAFRSVMLEPRTILIGEPVTVGMDMGRGDESTGYFQPAPNRLKGAYINEDGDAV